MAALHCCAPHDSVRLPNMHGWWRSWSAILILQTEIKRGHEKILCGAMCCNVSLMPNACEPRDGQHENGRVKVSFSPISGDVSCSSFLSMQSYLSGFSRVTSMNWRNCVKRFTESYWENLVWNLAGGIIAWVNQLIILSSLHKSKQEMSSGSICSLLKLSLTVFSMYQHGVSTNSRGALERERVRPNNGFCFPAAGQRMFIILRTHPILLVED